MKESNNIRYTEKLFRKLATWVHALRLDYATVTLRDLDRIDSLLDHVSSTILRIKYTQIVGHIKQLLYP